MPVPKLARCALSIAGSDSCGGAGIQADLKTFSAFGVHGATVISSVTAQNTLGVISAESVSATVLVAQLQAVLQDLPVRAIKTGMLPDPGGIRQLADCLLDPENRIPLVVDPVLIASSGSALGDHATMTALRKHLFPLAALLTPNLSEAGALTGRSVQSLSDMRAAGRELLQLGAAAVLMKGGHLQGGEITDVLVTREDSHEFSHPATPGVYHGTGCTLSAAITAKLALGSGLVEAVSAGIDFVQDCIRSARQPLKGPINLLGFAAPGVQ